MVRGNRPGIKSVVKNILIDFSSMKFCRGAFQMGPWRKQTRESKTHELSSSAMVVVVQAEYFFAGCGFLNGSNANSRLLLRSTEHCTLVGFVAKRSLFYSVCCE